LLDVEHHRNYAGIIAQASLWNDDMTRCEGFMKILRSKVDHSEKPIFATLTGKTVVPGFEMIDPEDGVKKLFFGFHDLSVRIAGIYRIKITAIDISGKNPCLSCFTASFQIFTSRMYPGREIPTPLTKTLLTSRSASLLDW